MTEVNPDAVTPAVGGRLIGARWILDRKADVVPANTDRIGSPPYSHSIVAGGLELMS